MSDFQLKNARRRQGRESVDRRTYLDARAKRRVVLGMFGNADNGTWNELAQGTSGGAARFNRG